jgi:hypothetical protein
MEASPLTQQSRPETFQPKVVHLYEELFKARIKPRSLGLILMFCRMRTIR